MSNTHPSTHVVDEFILLVPPPAHVAAAEAPIKSIWEAAFDNDLPTLRALLTSTPGDRDRLNGDSRWSPAISACRSDSIDALCCLAQRGADLDLNAADGLTAAFASAVSGSTRCLDFLIKRGVNLNVAYRNVTALDWLLAPIRTCRTHHESRLNASRESTARMLVLAGASVQSTQVCHYASRDKLLTWAERQLLEERAYFIFICGVHCGITASGANSKLAALGVGGVAMHIAGFLPRLGPLQLRRLVRAGAVWQQEISDEVAYEQQWFGT